MVRTITFAFAAVALFGCTEKSPPPAETPATVAPSRTETPPPATTPTATLPAANAAPDAGTHPAAEPEATGEGRMAKPGWCHEDSDCKTGEVCEKCGTEAQCIAGCHTDAQCGEGAKCGQVQCIRCPCPGQCEALNETPE